MHSCVIKTLQKAERGMQVALSSLIDGPACNAISSSHIKRRHRLPLNRSITCWSLSATKLHIVACCYGTCINQLRCTTLTVWISVNRRQWLCNERITWKWVVQYERRRASAGFLLKSWRLQLRNPVFPCGLGSATRFPGSAGRFHPNFSCRTRLRWLPSLPPFQTQKKGGKSEKRRIRRRRKGRRRRKRIKAG